MATTNILSLSLLLLTALASTQTTTAVEYTVTNTAGGPKFTNQIGVDYIRETLPKATDLIWNIFKQTNPADRKQVPSVTVFIDDGAVCRTNPACATPTSCPACAINDQIHLNANSIENDSGDVKTGVTGIIYHEMTHIWQWDGNRQAPGGLTEGIADFVRLKAGYAPSHWAKNGEGTRWDEGYAVTARFLDYIESVRPEFVAELNKKMKSAYNDSYFMDLTGKSVDQLWREYKARFGM